MVITRSAEARWDGKLHNGTGTFKVESGLCSGEYTFGSRFEGSAGSNPEELIGAALAACFSMAFAANLIKENHTPVHVHTFAQVQLDKNSSGAFVIKKIELRVEGNVPSIDQTTFERLAQVAKETCPVSKALGGVEKVLTSATLINLETRKAV